LRDEWIVCQQDAPGSAPNWKGAVSLSVGTHGTLTQAISPAFVVDVSSWPAQQCAGVMGMGFFEKVLRLGESPWIRVPFCEIGPAPRFYGASLFSGRP